MPKRRTVALSASASFRDLQAILSDLYAAQNDKWFDLLDLSTNVSRFSMRAIKAVRRLDERRSGEERVEENLGIALSWFASTANRLHLDLDKVLWRRFPGRCATCKSCPCSCSGETGNRAKAGGFDKAPRSIAGMESMFEAIYPPQHRSFQHAAIHLIEEVGEFEEAVLMYSMRHRGSDMDQIEIEAADYLSCLFGLVNSLRDEGFKVHGVGRRMAEMYSHNCHVCHALPCSCDFDSVMNFNLGDRW